MRNGYMRVSDSDGSHALDLQRDALLAAGITPDRIFEGVASSRKDGAWSPGIQPHSTEISMGREKPKKGDRG